MNEERFELLNNSAQILQGDLNKIDLVMICPLIPLEELSKANTFYAGKEGKNKLRLGDVYPYHLLDSCKIKGFESDYNVVSFKDVFSVDLAVLKSLVENESKRLRLKSPYREHLSQAFARYFMRVGLPSTIPPFE